jgi:hypothetical protein
LLRVSVLSARRALDLDRQLDRRLAGDLDVGAAHLLSLLR